MQRKFYTPLLLLFCIMPFEAHAAINTFYDLKLKFNEIKEKITSFIDSITAFKEAVATSPIYGIVFYSICVIALFAIVIFMIFVLLSLLRR